MAGNSTKHSIKSWLLFPYISILFTALVIVGGLLIYASISNSKLVLGELEEHMVEHVSYEIIESLAIAEQLNQINKDMFLAGNLKLDSQEIRETYFSNILKAYL